MEPKSKKCIKHNIDEIQPECRKCNGSGEVEWDDGICSEVTMETCWRCNGTGLAPWTICELCQDDFLEEQL